MIVRSVIKCDTCGQKHILRVGMGAEVYQRHRFPCVECHEDLVLGLHVDYKKISTWIEAEENCTSADSEEGGKVVNLDANFLIPEADQGKDFSFPRLSQMKMLVKAGAAGQPLDPLDPKFNSRPYRRPDFDEEWKLLKRGWSLHSNKKEKLAAAIVEKGSGSFYFVDPLKDINDWVWRFVMFLSGRHYQEKFLAAYTSAVECAQSAGFDEFMNYYDLHMRERTAGIMRKLLSDFFESYHEFSQVYGLVVAGLRPSESLNATSIDFDRTRMFYGNCFEAMGSIVDFLVYVRNLLEGRRFCEFGQMNHEVYLRLDKISKYGPLSGISVFEQLFVERDNQLRNASHHGGMTMDKKLGVIMYRSGKGGSGEVKGMKYAEYLYRCVCLFMQCLAAYRVEILLRHVVGREVPV